MADLPRPPRERESDYDGAWKEALGLQLAEFVAKYFPDEYAAIDWSCQPEWFDKELSAVLGQTGQRNRQVDVVARVGLKNGQRQWVLVHVEVQMRRDFEERFRVDLTSFEEERRMPYITSIERLAEERGEIQGEARGEFRGQANLILKLLPKFCGDLSRVQQQRVRELNAIQLEQLAIDLLQFREPTDLQNWFAAHGVKSV
jgi:hypothetical protein